MSEVRDGGRWRGFKARDWLKRFAIPGSPLAINIEADELIEARMKAVYPVVCFDSPTFKHQANPERYGDDVCIWCLEPFGKEVDRVHHRSGADQS